MQVAIWVEMCACQLQRDRLAVVQSYSAPLCLWYIPRPGPWGFSCVLDRLYMSRRLSQVPAVKPGMRFDGGTSRGPCPVGCGLYWVLVVVDQ